MEYPPPGRVRSGAMIRAYARRLWDLSKTPRPPPPRRDLIESALYGAAQPLLGLRILARDAALLREAFVPAAWLALICAAAAALGGDGTLGTFASRFYKIFAALAVAPPILFANHYARLAAQVRFQLGFGACGPREASLWFFAKRSLQGVLLVAFAAAPVYLFTNTKVLGLAAAGALGLWGLHWVVVDALDDARVLLPGETLASAEAAATLAPEPWFVRSFRRAARALRSLPIAGRPLSWVVRKFADVCDRLSLPWREEIALLEKNPVLGAGFALATSALLALPGLNLIFRPTIIVAGAHLLGHLEATEAGHGHPGIAAVHAAPARQAYPPEPAPDAAPYPAGPISSRQKP